MKITFDASGDSAEFVAGRDIRNSDHSNGTIEAGARIMFRRAGGDISLAYADDGRPTNGNQYLTFPSAAAAGRWAERVGVRPAPMSSDLYRALRERVGTQTAAAGILEIDPQTISRRERGELVVTREAAFAIRYLARQFALKG
jgi:hypothetical protein